MKKRFLSLILALVMVVTMIPASLFAIGPADVSAFGYTAANAMYIISVGNGKALSAPLGSDGRVTVETATAAYITATSDYKTGEVPTSAAYQWVYATDATRRQYMIGFASAVKANPVALMCFEGAFAANKAMAFSRTVNGAANPPTAGFSATAWEGFSVKPNGDGSVSFLTANGSSYLQIDPNDSTLKSTTNGSGTSRAANNNEKFVVVPTQVPVAPTGAAAADLRPTSATIQWTPGLDNNRYSFNVGFRVFRSEDNENFVELTSDSALAVNGDYTGYSYTDNNVVAGKTYYYKVAAASAIGNSPFSNVASATIPDSLPPVVLTTSAFFSSLIGAEDVVINVDLGFGTSAATGFSSVKVGDAALVAGTDYTFADSKLTIKADFLKNQPVGSSTIAIEFNDAAATKGSVAIDITAIPSSSDTFIVSTKTGKLIGAAATNPADNTMIATYASPVAKSLFQLKYSTNGNGMVGLLSRDNNQLVTVDDNTWGNHMIRLRSGNKDVFTGGWECLNFVLVGDGTVKITRTPATCWIGVQDNGNLFSSFNEAEAATFIVVPPSAPAAPTGLTIIGRTNNTVSFNWNKMNTFAANMKLYASANGGEYLPISADAAILDEISGLWEFTATNLTPDTEYNFKLVASNIRGASADSNVVSVKTFLGAPPAIPQNLAVAVADGKASLSWDAVADATGYDVYRANSRYSDNFVKINTTPVIGTAYVDAAAPGKWSYYKISSVSAVAESALSDAVSIETQIFGPNAYIYGPEDNKGKIQIDADRLSLELRPESSQFSLKRAALLFKPGDYSGITIENGYYMQVAGLGKLPTDVKLNKVQVTVAALANNNATCNFWRAVENVEMVATGTIGYGVSQAAPVRRISFTNASTIQFDVSNGWASGGYLADSYALGSAGSYPQQQFYYRNNNVNAVHGINWNLTTMGDVIRSGLAANEKNTVLETVPVIYEKPFLYFDNGEYYVFVPGRRDEAKGLSWSATDMGVGVSQSLDMYHVARADVDTADTVNAALAAGKNILFAPGVYYFDKAIEVNNPNTVLLGLGLASIIPTNGNDGMVIADVEGVRVAGLIFDAGSGDNAAVPTGGTRALLQVGTKGVHKDTSANPIVLSDLFFRVGGVDTPKAATAEIAIEINADDTLVDHFWVWRADHGQQVGWYLNKSDYGVVVNGDNVTTYGLFVEHFQKYDILWNGEYGKMYFLQNEIAYDIPYNKDWVSPDGKGWAALKVADHVRNFEGWGLGCYDVYINTLEYIYLDNGFVMPAEGNIKIHNVFTISLGTNGEITNVINGVGDKVWHPGGPTSPMRVMEWASAPLTVGVKSVSSPLASVVAGYKANIPVDVKSIESGAIRVELKAGDTVLATEVIADGTNGGSVMFMNVSVPNIDKLTIVASDEDTTAVGELAVVEIGDVWTIKLSSIADSKTLIKFNHAITAAPKGIAVSVNGNPAAFNVTGDADVEVDAIPVTGSIVKISGIMYADLFPSYSFTFSATI